VWRLVEEFPNKQVKYLQGEDRLEPSNKHNKKTDTKIEKLEKIIKDIGFGEIRVIIQDGKPIRIEEIKKSLKL
jgi:hypothetical protein